jgi:hypothetical protein
VRRRWGVCRGERCRGRDGEEGRGLAGWEPVLRAAWDVKRGEAAYNAQRGLPRAAPVPAAFSHNPILLRDWLGRIISFLTFSCCYFRLSDLSPELIHRHQIT